MNDLLIGPGMEVTLHFSLCLEDGSVVDSNFDNEPATFTVGDGQLLPGFEKVLAGLKSGQKNCFTIAPPDGFGERKDDNIQIFDRENFTADDEELAEGMVFTFADASGAELPGVLAEISSSEVHVDFNHPLAGHTITFDVEIVEVKPAVTH